MKKIVFSGFVAFIFCCGYSTRALLPPYLKSIYISQPVNNTTKPMLEEVLKRNLEMSFIKDGNLKVVGSIDEASLICETTIKNYSKSPVEYTVDQFVRHWRITITVHVKCTDQIKNRIFWEGDVSFWEDIQRIEDEEKAIDTLFKRISQEIVVKTVTNW